MKVDEHELCGAARRAVGLKIEDMQAESGDVGGHVEGSNALFHEMARQPEHEKIGVERKKSVVKTLCSS